MRRTHIPLEIRFDRKQRQRLTDLHNGYDAGAIIEALEAAVEEFVAARPISNSAATQKKLARLEKAIERCQDTLLALDDLDAQDTLDDILVERRNRVLPPDRRHSLFVGAYTTEDGMERETPDGHAYCGRCGALVALKMLSGMGPTPQCSRPAEATPAGGTSLPEASATLRELWHGVILARRRPLRTGAPPKTDRLVLVRRVAIILDNHPPKLSRQRVREVALRQGYAPPAEDRARRLLETVRETLKLAGSVPPLDLGQLLREAGVVLQKNHT